MNIIMLILMIALYLSSIVTMIFMKGQELLGIGLLAAALFVGAMELADRMENRGDSK